MVERPAYPRIERVDVLPYVPRSARRILDVGCSSGGFASGLRRDLVDREIWGVEADPDAAAQASEFCDRIIVGSFPDVQVDAQFDCVCFLDVLEHMYDPWAAIRSASKLLTATGVILACIPNARHYSLVGPLLFRGKWSYSEAGLMDRTHIRWFTLHSIVELFEDARLDVVELHKHRQLSRRARVPIRALGRLPGLSLGELGVIQYVVVAAPAHR